MTINSVILCTTLMSMLFIAIIYTRLKELPEGDGDMVELSSIIRDGAMVFMKAEYARIIPVVITVAVLMILFIEPTSGLTFVIGATMSSLACIFGMRSATYANVRTTETARKTRSIGETVQTAIRGGCICGLSVPTFGIFGMVLILIFGEVSLTATGHGLVAGSACNPTLMRITAYSLGCSLVAMFNRVAGGNLTKAADISADLVGKCDLGFDEDDWRVPNTVADFIGDNVNDIAGNCSDLLESFVATIGGTILISATIATQNANTSEELFHAIIALPLVIAGIGLVGSLLSILFVLFHKAGDKPSRELDLATYIAAAIVVIGSFFAAKIMLGNLTLFDDFVAGWLSPWIACVLGIASGVLIGKFTEYYTGLDFRPVKILANMAREGTAFVITKGDAIGARSCFLPMATIGIAMLGSYLLCGLYGIAIAALGMLAFVGTTVSIDAFGPVADNAGGITESCGLDHSIREITDLLDAVGNTTAAIGKGFAIGSAAFATTSLIFSYLSSYHNGGELILNLASPVVLVGGIFGTAFIWRFKAILTDNTINAAYAMAEAGKDQLRDPDILSGKKKPNYNELVKLSTNLAMKKMLGPSTLALLSPVVSGFLFGPDFLGGMLGGATLSAIALALYEGNSGGAFDNGKKYIEAGLLKYIDENGNEVVVQKGSEAHKAAVNGDTTGDTRKDVVGVDLDICIKMMATVSVIVAPIISNYNLMGLIF